MIRRRFSICLSERERERELEKWGSFVHNEIARSLASIPTDARVVIVVVIMENFFSQIPGKKNFPVSFWFFGQILRENVFVVSEC